MQGLYHRPVRLTAGPDLPRQRLFSHRPQELFKIQRVQGQALHFPHRKRILLPVDCHAEKTPGRYDMILRRLLTEIFQTCQCPLTGLDLIQKQKRPPRMDLLSHDRLQQRNDPSRSDIILEDRSYGAVRLQIDIDYILVVLLPEIQQDESLAHLPCAVEQQRHTAFFIVFPS